MALQTSYATRLSGVFAGMLADNGEIDVFPMRNDEASAEIPFGRAVRFYSATDPTSAKLPAAETDKIAGIVIHSHEYLKDTELGSTGLKPGVVMNVLRKGRIYVIVEDAFSVGDRLWVRAVAAGDPEFLGGINNADDSTDMVDCSGQGVLLTAGDAGAIGVLEVDFTNEPG